MFPPAIVRNLGITLDPSLTLDVYINKLSKAAFLQLCRSPTLFLCQPKRCRIISVCFYYIAHWLVMLFLLAYQQSQFLAYNTFKILLQVYYLTLNNLLISHLSYLTCTGYPCHFALFIKLFCSSLNHSMALLLLTFLTELLLTFHLGHFNLQGVIFWLYLDFVRLQWVSGHFLSFPFTLWI